MSAYYNEIDPYAAHWLRNLIDAGHIAPGDVDERSIAEVQPDDLRGYTQCHFFAGLGGWSLALRLAGWDDSRPVWTGSCPCQPFSGAGKQRGTADERHLWPEFYRLIAECRPATVFGEQVASRLGREWLAGVFADLEGVGYAVAGADLCAASVGAPHIRQRLWWVADAECDRREVALQQPGYGRAPNGERQADERRGGRVFGRLADTNPNRQQEQRRSGLLDGERATFGHDADGRGAVCGVGDAGGAGAGRDVGAALSAEAESSSARREHGQHGGDEPVASGANGRLGDAIEPRLEGHPGHGDDEAGRAQPHRPVAEAGSDSWSRYVWTPCADGKARRIEPGLEPLVDGVSNRVGRLRAYGNAIVPQVAAEFVRAAM